MRTGRRNQPEGLRHSAHLVEALQVAYYHCVLQMPLKSIAELLDKSPATVTRRLDEVRKAGWLHDRPDFTPPPDVWSELQNRMTCTEVESSLLDFFGRDLLQHVTVLPGARPGATAPGEARTDIVERVGLCASHRLSETLSEGAHVVGVNWGWSVRHCVVNLRPSHHNPALRFVPLVGSLSLDDNDPHYEEAVECSSNRLAQIAAAAFDAPRSLRLTTPAYIPRRFREDRGSLHAIRDFIQSDVSYRRIFGGVDDEGIAQTGLIDQVDTLITGLTSLDVHTLPIYRPNLITEADIPVLQRAGVVGDLALHMLVEADSGAAADSPERLLVERINSLIVGASPEAFVRVAERARSGESDGPGVVVLAVGAWKAPILTAAIRLRAVNELFTDLDTAEAIRRHVGIASASKRA